MKTDAATLEEVTQRIAEALTEAMQRFDYTFEIALVVRDPEDGNSVCACPGKIGRAMAQALREYAEYVDEMCTNEEIREALAKVIAEITPIDSLEPIGIEAARRALWNAGDPS